MKNRLLLALTLVISCSTNEEDSIETIDEQCYVSCIKRYPNAPPLEVVCYWCGDQAINRCVETNGPGIGECVIIQEEKND